MVVCYVLGTTLNCPPQIVSRKEKDNMNMRETKRWEVLEVMTALCVVFLVVFVAWACFSGCDHRAPVAVKAKIIRVDNEKTTLEFSNGVRRVVNGLYGESGEEIAIEMSKYEANKLQQKPLDLTNEQ